VDDCFQLDQQVSRHEIKVGAVLVAMGSSLYDVSMFPKLGYGTNPEVYTSAEFERILSATGPTNGEVVMRNGKAPKKIAIVHCVGSLDKHHREYCSGTCCQTAFKFNHGLSKKLPDLKFTHVYKELSMPGKDSSALFQNALHHGHTTLVRYENIDHLSATMHKEKTELSIKGDVIDSFDMIILMPAVVPSADTQKLANILDISLDQFGFFNELNSRISATQSNIKGIYLAGTCLGPKDIQQSVNDGVAAAGQALAGLIPGHKIEVEPITAEVNKDTCSGCRVCISVCPYKAISFIEAEKVSDVNVVLCQGCGTCVAACPSGSMIGNFFTNDEILAEIKEVLAS
jgi:heterodisulfide reductase subunit A